MDFKVGDRAIVVNVDDFSAKEKLTLLHERGTVTEVARYVSLAMDNSLGLAAGDTLLLHLFMLTQWWMIL